MEFRQWIESSNEVEWQRLWQHILTQFSIGPFDAKNGQNWHSTLVGYVRNVGLNDIADELDLARPSQEDIEFGNTPSGMGFGATFGDVLKHKQNRAERQQKQQEFSASSKAYYGLMDTLADKVWEYGRFHGFFTDQ